MSEFQLLEPVTPACVSTHSLRVRFAETDLMGIVHHSNYLKYFEAARVEYLRVRGSNYSDWVTEGLNLPIVEVAVRYLKPARFDDELHIETRVTDIRGASVRFDYSATTTAHKVCQGFTRLACVGDAGRPIRMPSWTAEVIRRPPGTTADTRGIALP